MISEACGCMICETCEHVDSTRCAASDELIAALEAEPLAVVEAWMLEADVEQARRGLQPGGRNMWLPLKKQRWHKSYPCRPVTVTITERREA